jgi:hypothetical protein
VEFTPHRVFEVGEVGEVGEFGEVGEVGNRNTASQKNAPMRGVFIEINNKYVYN